MKRRMSFNVWVVLSLLVFASGIIFPACRNDAEEEPDYPVTPTIEVIPIGGSYLPKGTERVDLLVNVNAGTYDIGSLTFSASHFAGIETFVINGEEVTLIAGIYQLRGNGVGEFSLTVSCPAHESGTVTYYVRGAYLDQWEFSYVNDSIDITIAD